MYLNQPAAARGVDHNVEAEELVGTLVVRDLAHKRQ
jgi:hypothetical protein